MFRRLAKTLQTCSRWWIVAAALLLVAFIASGAARLKFDNSTDAFFLKNDDTLLRYDAFRKYFASDEYSLITFEAPANIDAKFVAQLRAVEKSLAQLAHVRKVTSLASVRAIEGNKDGLDVHGYLEGVAPERIAAKVKRATGHPYYRDLFISGDGNYLGMVVETEIIPGAIDYKMALRDQIRAVIAQSALSARSPTIVGAPILDADVRDIVGRESGSFGGLVFLIVGAGFFLLFRSVLAVIIPLLVAVLAIAATFGIMGWTGMPITLLTPILPSFLISVGVSSSIFLLMHYFQHRAHSDEPGNLVARKSARGIWLVCALASGTTIAALFAFSGSDIAPVQHIGVSLGCGLLVALLLTFTLGAALLEIFPPKVNNGQLARLQRRYTWLNTVDEFSRRHRYLVFGAAFLVTAAAAVALTRLKIDYYYLGTFKEGTAIRKDYRISDARLPRSAAIEIVLTGADAGAFTDPAALARVERVQAAINGYTALPVKSYSLADVLKEINQALQTGAASAYRIPNSRAQVSQELLLFESSGSDEMSHLATSDYRTTRITVQLPTVPESQSSQLRAYIDRALSDAFKDSSIQYSLTGLVPMWMKINSYLRSTQIQSVLLAFGVTVLVLMVYARSLWIGLLLSFVNASVVIVVLGVMAALQIPLDPYTVLIADIAIGVLDDDTLHFFTDIRERLRTGIHFDAAVQAARGSSGQAMYGLAFCLVSGFLVYVFSNVASLAIFGCLVALMIALGLIWEWVVMPAYLAVLYRFGVFR